jgi:hypothetical protein
MPHPRQAQGTSRSKGEVRGCNLIQQRYRQEQGWLQQGEALPTCCLWKIEWNKTVHIVAQASPSQAHYNGSLQQ